MLVQESCQPGLRGIRLDLLEQLQQVLRCHTTLQIEAHNDQTYREPPKIPYKFPLFECTQWNIILLLLHTVYT